MKISKFNGQAANEMKHVDEVLEVSLDDIASVICKSAWSPFLFNPGESDTRPYRHHTTFIGTDILVFDIDDGTTINEAIERCKGDSVIIATTKSHQKPKSSGKTIKPACDRFRVIKILERAISDQSEYIATWLYESKKLGCVDEQCKDVARFYFPCVDLVYVGTGATTCVRLPELVTKKVQSKVSERSKDLRNANESWVLKNKGKLLPSTENFIENGTSENWHTCIFKATCDLKEQGYSYEEAEKLLRGATLKFDGDLDEHDYGVLNDVYEKRGGKLDYRPAQITNLNEGFIPPSSDELNTMYDSDAKLRRESRKNPMTFLSSACDQHFKITSGATFIGGVTGSGKSTTNHNLIKKLLLKHPEKKILLISNEETVSETYSMIACLMLNLNWKADYHEGKDEKVLSLVDETAKELTKSLTVITASDKYDTSYVEDVESIMNYAKNSNGEFSIVLVDYLQTISNSRKNPGAKTFEISKEFGFFIKQYVQVCPIPVIVFVQLKEETSENKYFKTRVENDNTFANHGHNLLEIRVDKVLMTTTIVCHKNRWGSGWQMTLNYRKGALEPAQ
jgi:hypothetical protein